MKRSLFGGSFLIVEGTTDGRLYGKFTDRMECEIIPAHCKENVIRSVREMFRRRNEKRIIGIVDSDNDRLNGTMYENPIFVTDRRDIDTVMIESRAFYNVLSEYGDRGRIERFTERYGDIRDSVVASCYPLGILMHLSEKEGWGLSFKDLDHQLFVNRRTLRLDTDAMVSALIDNSQHSRVDAATVITALAKEMKEAYDPWDVCRGHDLIAVLAIGLRDIFGCYNCRSIRPGELAGALRLAYDDTSFRGSALFRDSEEWCVRNRMKVWS